MNKKNACILKSLILLSITITPSFHLWSSQRRLPAGKRPLGYSGPITPKPTPASLPAPTLTEQTPATKIEKKNQEIDQEMEEEQEQEEQDAAASAKGVQAVSASPGWLTIAYAIILETLDKALGSGIKTSTEILISKFIKRKAFLSLKNDLLAKANSASELRPELKTLSDEEKLELAKHSFLTNKDQKKFNANEQDTTISSIFSQATYAGILTTIFPMIGTLIGYGFTIGLNRLMPIQK